MLRRKKLQLGIIALVVLITNNVKSEEICRHRCEAPSGNQQLHYQPHTTYTYDFISDLDLSLSNAKGQNSRTHVKTTVLLTQQDQCGFILKLQNFKIIGGNSQTYENIDGIEKPVTFQYLNGAIGADICAEPDDPPQSLNVKRAIISAFQLDSRGHQTDIFGVCPTESDVDMKNGETYIRKTRNLNKCAKRENLEQNFIAETLKSQILKSVPILTSAYLSLQNLNGGILKSAEIFENYTYMASKSSDGNEIAASVKTYLRYTGVTVETVSYSTSTESKSIIFDKTRPNLQKDNMNAIGDTFTLLMRNGIDLHEDTSRNFLNLVKIMRDTSKDELLLVYDRMKRNGFNNYVRKIYIAALTRCGTSAALTAGLELASNKDLTPNEERLLYIGFSYVTNPTTEVVKVAGDLLATNRLSQEAYLGVGNLIRRYCEQRSCPNRVTSEITSTFGKKLSQEKTTQKTEIVYILKALLNVGQLPDDTTRIVLALAQNPQNSAHIRSVALDTLTTAACQTDVRNSLLHTLQNIDEDSEIRIKSYLVLSKCPNLHIAQTIESMINTEPTNQVGSFISTHVKSLTNILSTINIQNTYPNDARRYSFNDESVHSFAGMKHKTSTNVIYSQKSFLPRFANLNVTSDILGTNVNLFEIEVRQENFDRMLEHYFGPAGELRGNPEFKRVRQYSDGPDMDLDINIKLFGSDFLFFNINERPRWFTETFFRFLAQDLQSKMDLAMDSQNNMIFIDSQFSYPTSLGFPIRLSVEGVSSLQLSVLDSPDWNIIKYGFVPSATVEITSTIGVDASVVESGIKVISKLHVATGVAVEVMDNDKGSQERKLSFPLQEQKVSFSHDIYFNVREIGEPDLLKPIHFENNQIGSICIDHVLDATGLDLCLQFNIPQPSDNIYLSGNYKAAVVLNNTDFSHLSLKKEYNDKKEIQLSARVVGKQQNTKTGLVVDASLNDGYMVKVTGILSKHNASIEARLNNTIAEKSLYMDLRMDHQKFFTKFGIRINQTSDRTTFTPLVYVSVPGKYGQHYPINTKGSVSIYQKGHDFKISLHNLQLILGFDSHVKIYSVDGRLGNDNHGYFVEFMVSDGHTVIQTGEKLRAHKNKIKFSGYLTNNRNPDLNLHINYELSTKPAISSSVLEIVHGPDSKSKINCFTVKDTMVMRSQDHYFELKNRITYPPADFDVKGDFVSDLASTLLDVEFKFGDFDYGTKLDAKYHQNHPEDYVVSLIAYDGLNRIGITGSRLIEGGINNVNHTFFYNKALYELSGQIILPQSADRTHSMKLVFKLPNVDPFYITGRAYQDYENSECYLLINDVVNKYIDFKLSKARSSSNFDMQVFVERVLKLDTHFTNAHTSGNGDFFIDLFEDHSIKLDLVYSITSVYYVKTTLYPNYRKQPTLSMSFTTNTQNEPHMFDSRNLFEVAGQTYADVSLKYSNHRGATNAEVKLVTKDDASAGIQFQTTYTGDYNFMDVAYQVSAESRNLLQPYHDTVKVRFEKNYQGNQQSRHTILASTNTRNTGPIHFNTTLFTVYDKPWTGSQSIIFKLFQIQETDGINFETILNNTENKLWNCVLNLKAFENNHDIFLKGTYKDEGSGTPITLNITGSVKTELLRGEFDYLKINSTNVFTPPLYNRYYNVKTDTDLRAIRISQWEHTKKFHGDINVCSEDGTISLTSHHDNRISSVFKANYSLHNLEQFNQAIFKLNYNDGNYPILSMDGTYSANRSQFDLDVRALYVNTPISLGFGVKEVSYGIAYDAFGLFQVEKDKYDLVGQVSIAAETPKVNIEVKHGVTDQFLIELDHTTRGVAKGIMRVSINDIPFLFENKWTYENWHKFVFYHAHHCPCLQVENFKMHLSNSPTRLENTAIDTLHYNVTILRDNVISGSTNFSITLTNKIHNFNCTSIIRLMNDQPKEYIAAYHAQDNLARLSAKFDEHTMESTLKIRPRHMSVTYSFCDQIMPCFQIRAIRKNHSNNKKMELHDMILVDTRYFGGHKVDLKNVYVITPQEYNFTGEAIFNDYAKYFSTYLVKEDEVSVSFETPRRQISLNSYKTGKQNGSQTFQLDFYPNKFNTKHKTSLSTFKNCMLIKCDMELRLSDSNLPRDLVVAYAGNRYQIENIEEQTFTFDVFKREEDKIILSSKVTKHGESHMSLKEIKSQGLGFNFNQFENVKVQTSPEPILEYIHNTQLQFGKNSYNTGFVAKTNAKEMLLNVTVFSNNVFMVNTKLTSGAKKSVFDTDVKIIGVAPVYARLETKNYNSLNLTVGTKGNYKDAFQLTAKLFGPDIARIQATKNNQTLSVTSLTLQSNNLNYNYKYDALGIERNILKPAKREVDFSIQTFKNSLDNVKKELSVHSSRLERNFSTSIPNFESVLRFYKNEVNTFKHELHDDPALRDLAPIIGQITDLIFDLTQTKIEETYRFGNIYLSSILETEQQEVYSKLLLSKDIEEMIFNALVDLNFIMGKYEKEMREFGVEFFNTIEEAFIIANTIRFSLMEGYRNFKNNFVLNKLTQDLTHVSPPSEGLIKNFREMMKELKSKTTSAEMMKLLDLVGDYSEKKLNDEDVEDDVALDEISDALGDVLNVILNTEDDSVAWETFSTLLEMGYLETRLGLDQLQRWNAQADFFTRVAVSEYQMKEFPKDFTGIIAQSHVFTFDGMHVTLQGECNLLMVKDVIDGNFSITAHYNGSIASLTFTDKNAKVVIEADGDVTSLRYPDHSKPQRDIEIVKKFDRITINSRFGVELKCDLNLVTCIVKVSGYYHAHLKGILGTANNEPYDDFTMSNGRITTNIDEFATSYKTGKCKQIQASTNVPWYPKCNHLFAQPEFRQCSKIINTNEYEIACNEGLHLGIGETENVITRAYAAICHTRGINVRLYNSEITSNYIAKPE
ncbi:hypothetical protein RN001_011293 [Aquatica leii]|uniref:Vitellogenin domain-containing protein n=1 Tax=Aquatica leii TaxID=1421715 RepID=A0AAN7P7Q5_9COLE|nr:hypothetical protein RN001_011293 [Aquatica leii]